MGGADDIAVLLTCHGTVEHIRDIPDFVRNIRHGRAVPANVVAEVTRRFELIGGSPLMKISHAQAEALEARLGVPVRAAGRLWGPYPKDVLAPLLERGVRHIISVPLAPQSVHIYHRFVRQQLEPLALDISCAPAYGLEDKLVGAFVNAIVEARARLSDTANVATILTAHSLPTRVIDAGDPYQREFEAMARAIADALEERGFDASATRVAYQSQGMDGGSWLGPDLSQTLQQAHASGANALLVAAVGFVAEHVETLFDIDVEASELARTIGFAEVTRMPAMNARADFIDALEAVARPLLTATSA